MQCTGVRVETPEERDQRINDSFKDFPLLNARIESPCCAATHFCDVCADVHACDFDLSMNEDGPEKDDGLTIQELIDRAPQDFGPLHGKEMRLRV